VVTIGSVYELKYAALLASDLITAKFSRFIHPQKFSRLQ
jgi:hypothetical protein